eukprot:TRINITY_DN4750_c0_g1_i1.p1 TRINITY_DN4750_c0_g1~~TRINITY_DN4750_c0_g1_i1.p1  ORF type:complete len:1197 (+),score=405.96 TRINITY_DN4750_c0_g1_i1:120-3710(+)
MCIRDRYQRRVREFAGVHGVRGCRVVLRKGRDDKAMTTRIVDQVVDRIRSDLPGKGAHAFRSLVVALDKTDWNKSKAVDKEQLRSALHTVGVTLTPQDLDALFNEFSMGGQLPYETFLGALRGGISSRARLIVDRAFENLDLNGTGRIEMSHIRRSFQAGEHPSVRQGRQTAQQATEQFLYVINHVTGSSSRGAVTLEQWRQVWGDIYTASGSDEEFVQAVCAVWGIVELGESNVVLAGIHNQCRAYCAEKGVRSKEFFKDFDKLNTGLITEAQFLRALDSAALPVNAQETQHILDAYKCNKNRAAMVKYQIFCNRVDGLEAADNKFETNPGMGPEELTQSPLTEKRRELDSVAEEYVLELLEYLKYKAKTEGWIFKNYYKDFDRHNIGKVTPMQFRRNFPIELEEQQLVYLERKYQDPIFGDINYRALHDDITEVVQSSSNLEYGANSLGRQAPEEDVRESAEIELRLQNEMFQKRIRLKMFFHDYDRLRTGLCTAGQFKRALQTAFKNMLTAHELSVLSNEYIDRNDSLNRVCHRKFVTNMDNVFNTEGLERRPRTPVAQPHQWQLDEFGEKNSNLSNSEKQQFAEIMDQICTEVSSKRLNLKPFFENFDRNHMEEVTKDQFTRSLYTADINLSESAQAVLRKAFQNPLRRNLINYGFFWEDVKSRLPKVPSCIGSAPTYLCKTLAKDPDDPDPDPPTSKGGVLYSTALTKQKTKTGPNDIDLEGLLDKLRSHVLVKSIRVKSFFQDFDRLRSGFVSKPNFRSAMAIANLMLTEPELALLETQYQHPNATDKVNWRSFTDDMDLVFNQKGLEANPLTDGNLRYVPGSDSLNPNYVPTKEGALRTVSEQEDQRISAILASCELFLNNNRIVSLYQYFQQFDVARSGKVTKKQFFRVLDGIRFAVSVDDQELVCKRYMDIGGKVNYNLFCDHVQADKLPPARDTAVPGYEGSPPLSFVTPWESKLRPPGTPEVDITSLLDLMRAHVVRERVRTYDALHAHDRHNSGRMQPVKFQGVLNQLGFKLTAKEASVLESHFGAPGCAEICYREFVDAMESSFTQKGLEKAPTIKVKSFQPMMPSDEIQPLDTDGDEAFTDDFMKKIAQDLALRRIQPKVFFQQYDRCNIGSVTAAQFKAVMKNLDCPLSDSEFALLGQRYHKGDRRIVGDIGYVKFCRDLVEKVDNPPIQTSFGPGTDGPC